MPAVRQLCGAAAGGTRRGRRAVCAAAEADGASDAGAVLPVRAVAAAPRGGTGPRGTGRHPRTPAARRAAALPLRARLRGRLPPAVPGRLPALPGTPPPTEAPPGTLPRPVLTTRFLLRSPSRRCTRTPSGWKSSSTCSWPSGCPSSPSGAVRESRPSSGRASTDRPSPRPPRCCRLHFRFLLQQPFFPCCAPRAPSAQLDDDSLSANNFPGGTSRAISFCIWRTTATACSRSSLLALFPLMVNKFSQHFSRK